MCKVLTVKKSLEQMKIYNSGWMEVKESRQDDAGEVDGEQGEPCRPS